MTRVRIAFPYQGRHRVLDDPVVRFTKAFDLIVTGTDPDLGKVRAFRIDRMGGRIRRVPRQGP